MARRRASDDDEWGTSDPGDADYSVLLAEADKIRADSQMAVKKVVLLDETQASVQRSNDIFKRALSGAVGR